MTGDERQAITAAWLVLIGLSTLAGLAFGWRFGVGVASALLTIAGLQTLAGASSKRD